MSSCMLTKKGVCRCSLRNYTRGPEGKGPVTGITASDLGNPLIPFINHLENVLF